ncbi:acyl carrier protein [Actinokineospora guangxiensis]|uniref:Acyl carrier protein n=1 Tax=Actinokineospora guangxiensis TaxID=1490288 RepID=A0ABW0ETB8_9PSEU
MTADGELITVSTYDRLASILVENFKVPEKDIVRETCFDDMGVDSLFLVEYLVVVEEKFGINIEDEKIGPADSLEQLSDLVDARLAEAERSA